MINSEDLYSYKGQEPKPIPEKIRLSNGNCRTDISSFTNEELLDAGYTGPYSKPTNILRTRNLEWNSEKMQYELIPIDFELCMTWVRYERYKRLSELDWVVLEDCPLSDEQKQEYLKLRQELRDLPSTLKTIDDIDSSPLLQ